MGKINVLSFAVANLIAAGEVVDRPASVIKELMENAIDAGASRVTVEIQNGGTTFMRVTDNGCGMSSDDLPVAIRRHATSKIKDASDLESIITLGFRGEALAAIASVSDLRILSKTRDAEFGSVLYAHGGENITVSEQGCSDGTSVIVENLFYNVPARRKFLKKDVTESMAVSANVEKVALSHPEIAFRLIVDGAVRLETMGDGILLNAIHSIFGKEFASRLIEINADNEGIVIRGFIGRTDNFKANRNFQNTFINGRYIKSKTVMAALEQAYTSYMPPEKFPCCVLFMDINPSRVDVNVHPAKLEVKFSNEKAIFEAVYYTVRSALEANVTRPEIRLDKVLSKSGFTFPGGKVSAATVPVPNGRQESLRTRQLSYDLEGRTQPQPEEQRISAEDYRKMMELPAVAPTKAVSKSEQSAPALQKNDPGAPVRTPDRQAAPASEPLISMSKSSTADSVPAAKDPSASSAQNAVGDPVKKPNTPSVERTDRLLVDNPVDFGRIEAGVKHTADLPNYTVSHDTVILHTAQASESAPAPTPIAKAAAPVPQSMLPYRIVGDVFHSYVIVEVGEKMLLIDQHAAHERILFEQLKAGLADQPVCSQMMMLPIEIMLTGAEVSVLHEYEDELKHIGFALRFARNTVYADAIPEGVETDAVCSMLQTMAGRLIDNTGNVRLTRDIIFEKALYQGACKAAIKAGREYAPEHIEWVVKKLMEIPDITFCPHGRPVAIELTRHALDKQFDRTGF